MRAAAIFFGLALSLSAGAALACPDPYGCGREADRYDQRYAPPYDDRHEDRYGPSRYEDETYGEPVDDERYDDRPVWREADGSLYMYGHRAAPCGQACVPCGCRGEGLTLSSSFFHDAGGVGPIPDGGYYGGGGYVIVGGGASSSAYASASARASASVSIRYRGGYGHRPGGHKPGHGGGHKGKH